MPKSFAATVSFIVSGDTPEIAERNVAAILNNPEIDIDEWKYAFGLRSAGMYHTGVVQIFLTRETAALVQTDIETIMEPFCEWRYTTQL